MAHFEGKLKHYQRPVSTGLNWSGSHRSLAVFTRSGLLRSFNFPVLSGPGPVQSRSLAGPRTGPSNTKANAVDETLTLEQLHRRMGHISPVQVIARKLVENNLVTGVQLETTPSGDQFFCESCVYMYAKATRKVIPNAREGERAVVFAIVTSGDPRQSRLKKRNVITSLSRMTTLESPPSTS